MGEIIFLALLLVGDAFLYYLTGDFRVSKLDTSGGAALFPRIILILLAIFIVIRILQILCAKEKKEFAFRELFEGSRLFFLVSLVLYVLLLKPLGYVIATSLFTLAVANGFYRTEKGNFGTAKQIVLRNILLLVFIFAINFAFGHLLKVNLPDGLLSF